MKRGKTNMSMLEISTTRDQTAQTLCTIFWNAVVNAHTVGRLNYCTFPALFGVLSYLRPAISLFITIS